MAHSRTFRSRQPRALSQWLPQTLCPLPVPDAWCAFILTIVGISFLVFLVEQLGSMGFVTVIGPAFNDLRLSVYRNILCM